MKFTEEDYKYIEGKEFSNGRKFEISKERGENRSRIQFLLDETKEKSIVHFGFADHIPLIKEKINKNKWLHKLLIDNTSLCVGIDIEKKSVQYLKDEYAIDNIYALDIEKDSLPDQITNQEFDYLLLGEVLEHTDNPVSFLKSIHDKFNTNVNRIIITVPNAYDIASLNQLRMHKEFINTDHRFWFTPFTLAKVLSRAGYCDFEFEFCQSYFPKSRWQKYVLKKYPATRETLIMTARF